MNRLRFICQPIQLCKSLRFNPRSTVYRFLASDSDKDAPVKFSESPASGWKASYTRQGINKPDVSAWFQPYVVVASCVVFLVYFCILREENDIDDLLSVSLYDRIEGLEKIQLQATLRYNLDNNLPTEKIEKRLREIELEEIRLGIKKE